MSEPHPDDTKAKDLGFMPLRETLNRCEYVIGSGVLRDKQTESLFLSVKHHLYVLDGRRKEEAGDG